MMGSFPASAHFLSCDWGTSAFRLRLVEADTLRVLAETRNDEGIALTFAAWKAKAGAARRDYFLTVIRRHLVTLAGEANQTLDDLPLLVSGMASSSLGMEELPYKVMPFALDGSDLHCQEFAATSEFPHDVLLISGVRTSEDVMRGEETQLVGASGEEAAPGAGGTYIFPGTHSKHVLLGDTQAIDFKTYMTGEFFDLLSKRSVLAQSVELPVTWDLAGNVDHFSAGVRAGAKGNLLHDSFLVRTRSLLQGVARVPNFYYLSGLLIGSELQAAGPFGTSVTLVGGGRLAEAYRHAFHLLGGNCKVAEVDADLALIRGHWRIATRHASAV